ncbi:UNVERIFIED_CONTAM: hypothetical protein PYX00_009544 [Menopon gallinae]|uniref:Uncharacterized protein n=1 Tax=Menopon gallinae TaxID=328185 RepID=A0AAW2HBM8_9NEOP
MDSRAVDRRTVESRAMENRTKRCAFHILQINSNFVGNISPWKLCTKRSNYRVKPYFTPINRLFPVQSETISERTRTKSENSDTGNENVDVKDCETVISSVGLYKSKSLENINTSSPSSSSSTRDFKMELDELQKRTEESTDVELVSSKIKCLNVSNK